MCSSKSGLWRKNCLGLNFGFIVSLSKLPICLSFLIHYLRQDVLRIKTVPVCKVLRITERRTKQHLTNTGCYNNKTWLWDFPGGPVEDFAILLQGAKFRSLIRELRSHMLCGQITVKYLVKVLDKSKQSQNPQSKKASIFT